MFYDLLCSGSEQGGEPSWVEVVVKLVRRRHRRAPCRRRLHLLAPPRARHATAGSCTGHATAARCPTPLQGTYGSIEEVKDLRDRLKLGDVVAATGRFLPARRELQAAAVAVLAPWRDSHPGQSFTPRPAPPHAAAEPPQPAAAEQQQRSADSNSPQKQQAGADLAPVPEGPQGTTAAAAAAAAAAAGAVRRPSAQRQVCKYFVNSGRCAKGASCPFAHEHTGALRQRWLADM